MTEYEPGRLYLATVQGEPNIPVHRSGGFWVSLRRLDGRTMHYDQHVTDVRLAVVLDPESYGDALELTQRAMLAPGLVITDYVERIQTALRSLVKPPIPDQPSIGSVVVDKGGAAWQMGDDGRLDSTQTFLPKSWGDLWDERGPLKVVYRPDEAES